MLVKLGDIAEVLISNVDKKSKPNEKEIKLCNFVDVYKNYAITDRMTSSFMVATASNQSIEKFTIKKGYLAITKDSETRDDIGVGTYFADDFDNLLLGYHCALIKPNNKLVYSKYLNAFIQSNFVRKYYELNASGSGQRYTLTLESILSTPILLPDYDKQVLIGDMLSNTDHQIERNNLMVKKLQVLTQSIYSYWFNQFEFPNEEGKPYKSSGGEMVWNEELKKLIPKNWTILKLKDILKRVNVNVENDISLPTIDLSVMPAENISLNSLNNSDNFTSNLNRMFEGNILFGSIRPYLKKCGIAPCNGAVAGTVYQFEEIKKKTYNYSVITMSQNSFFEYALKKSKGTRMPVVSADDLLEYSFPYNEKIFNLFNELPLKKIIVKTNKSSKELIQLKEKLLPLLINGQLI